MPGSAAVFGFEQCRVFHSGVNVVGGIESRLKVPHPFEFPRMLGAVVPLMGARNSVVTKIIARAALRHSVGSAQILFAGSGRFPGFPAVVRSLNDLSKPRAGLRRVNPVRIYRRTFDVINLPAGKMRSVNLPPFALAV